MAAKKTNRSRKWVFSISIALNVLFVLGWLFNYSNSPTYKLGVLTQDVNAGFLSGDSTIYIIPKGITVRDVSPRGINAIGQFENNRFELILTTEREGLVDYNKPKDSLFQFGNLYSADNPMGTAR
jgi:hypothetical protein